MNQSNDSSLKQLPVILLIAHLNITLLITFLTGNYVGLLGLLGAIGYTLGSSIIVLVSFFLSLYKKINKTGTYVSISLQVLSSIGIYCSKFVNTQDSFFVLGLVCGIACNSLYIASMIILLNKNSKPNTAKQIQTNVNPSTSKYEFNATIKFCGKCGNNLIPGSKFCPFCGSKIEDQVVHGMPNHQSTQSNETRSHFDFTNLNQNRKNQAAAKLNHIKTGDDEQVLIVGEFTKKPFSLFCWIIMSLCWTFFILVISNTDNIASYIEIKSSFSVPFVSLTYGASQFYAGQSYDIFDILFIGVLGVFLLFAPLIIFSIIRKNVLKNELALTSQNIYFYSPIDDDTYRIPLSQIKCIDCKQCLWFWDASRIKITRNIGDIYSISGLSNAQEFIQCSIKAAQKRSTQTGE